MGSLLVILLLVEPRVDQRLLLGAGRLMLMLLLLDLLELGLTFSFCRSMVVMVVTIYLILLHLLKKVLLPRAFKLHPLMSFNIVFFSDVGHYTHGMTHSKGVISDKSSDRLAHVIDF